MVELSFLLAADLQISLLYANSTSERIISIDLWSFSAISYTGVPVVSHTARQFDAGLNIPLDVLSTYPINLKVQLMKFSDYSTLLHLSPSATLSKF